MVSVLVTDPCAAAPSATVPPGQKLPPGITTWRDYQDWVERTFITIKRNMVRTGSIVCARAR